MNIGQMFGKPFGVNERAFLARTETDAGGFAAAIGFSDGSSGFLRVARSLVIAITFSAVEQLAPRGGLPPRSRVH